MRRELHRAGSSVAFPHRCGEFVVTLPEAFQATVALGGDATALRSHDRTTRLSWRRYGDAVRDIACGLLELSVEKGETIGLMLANRPEFHLVDTAALHVGATPFSIYNTMAPQQIAEVCANAQNRIIVTESRFLPVLRQAGVTFEVVICIDDPIRGTLSLDRLAGMRTQAHLFESVWRDVRPDDLATISYTSGTTGSPKGVELSHANILAQLVGLADHLPVGPRDRILSYLPAAHIADRVTAHYGAMVRGVAVTTLHDPTRLAEAMSDTRPTIVFGVPQVWQKTRSAIERGIETAPSARVRRVGRWALAVGQRCANMRSEGATPGPWLRLRYRLADRLVLRRVLRAAGLDAVRFAVSGAAPLSEDAAQFFPAFGIALTQVWGLTEATGVCTTTSSATVSTSSVGTPVAGIDMRLGIDGEIFVRGPAVMRGYHRDPSATYRAIDAEGWLRTGDLGEIDTEGGLRIVGRKSEMIITDEGDNISPAIIENAIAAASFLIGHVIVVGEQRPYLTALITLDEEAIAADARLAQVEPAALEVLCQRPGVREAVSEAVRAVNSTVSGPEQVRRFILLDHVWRLGSAEVTPKSSLRRRSIEQNYAAQIDSLYHSSPPINAIDVTITPAPPKPAFHTQKNSRTEPYSAHWPSRGL
ncbi:AMP-dependent synthetase/ligase [Nocardia alba]|uniref:Long-subunit acyl-CoA synthetase (AMP-forming) n=1 Tax=Nocardia alba TaxID=225051 RepID=A0A4R1FQB1_9NOCA|nr:AMP-binding protein [Nocardia alba]TCJ97406.1 long-subunit acyl-CoA synthetase (AMP-forming) [Nocardia alba]